MTQSVGYAAQNVAAPLERFDFTRRDPGPADVVVEIAYCGICHSDIHQVRDEWGGSMYPMVPGHEIVGHVTAVGADVTKFKVGDLAGVGVMVDSCKVCANCKASEEAYCEKGFVGTYNAKGYDGKLVFGGYANNIVVDERYVFSISPKLEAKLAAVAPLLCAGITTYSPLRHWKVGPGMKVGIVGLGGLGHMGLKFAHSFGAHVTLFTTSAGKEADAKRLGADEVVISKDADAMAKQKSSFDFILDCVSAPHDMNTYLGLLRLNGTLCLVGLPEEPLSISAFSTVTNRRSLAGSMIGGMTETQEMLDYCAEHDIVSDIELTSVDKLDEAYERVVKSDVKYRFVIDLATLKS
ncbi:NAD(P)-dependent alcohol dehydrogenase [Granulicella tundricola]|uniref:Alcohol dehydrogenase zinc-binding domain protein n=1 Tax=Granulicella tundricola (strain ATCC BAA-1859 / DSM 23138 / MP5ACTX9) TaxID=1198114 RepID=E8X084_GRATM|nr:NAD(P)-dependent alcohol dehydrogenase [Granulicella tundricola]ADW70065.1 Alcohol dehydrogenase zinc-binding domain protein [Granulicella tundricola MP5ACTX9]